MNRTLFVALLVACTGGGASTKNAGSGGPSGSSTTGSDAVSQTKKPGATKPSVNWVKGPAVTAAASELVAWFEAQKRNGEPRMTRVPIVLKRGDAGWSSQGVKIGGLEVFVTDTALGMGIAMRANKCSGETCPFVVEGFWRGKADRGYHYEIRNASKSPATPEELAAVTHLEVEGESGN
jgi:hypothetical protein